MTKQVKPARDALKARRDDMYPTHPDAVRTLFTVEDLARPPERIWEPCAGRGDIVDVLRAAGHDVVASDLVDYGIPGQFARWDFLLEQRAPPGVVEIVTNPPFKLAAKCVEHGLVLCPRVIVLLRTLFLEAPTPPRIAATPSRARAHFLRPHPRHAPRRMDRQEGEHRPFALMVCLRA